MSLSVFRSVCCLFYLRQLSLYEQPAICFCYHWWVSDGLPLFLLLPPELPADVCMYFFCLLLAKANKPLLVYRVWWTKKELNIHVFMNHPELVHIKSRHLNLSWFAKWHFSFTNDFIIRSSIRVLGCVIPLSHLYSNCFTDVKEASLLWLPLALQWKKQHCEFEWKRV